MSGGCDIIHRHSTSQPRHKDHDGVPGCHTHTHTHTHIYDLCVTFAVKDKDDCDAEDDPNYHEKRGPNQGNKMDGDFQRYHMFGAALSLAGVQDRHQEEADLSLRLCTSSRSKIPQTHPL